MLPMDHCSLAHSAVTAAIVAAVIAVAMIAVISNNRRLYVSDRAQHTILTATHVYIYYCVTSLYTIKLEAYSILQLAQNPAQVNA
jgi:hypothetical protein